MRNISIFSFLLLSISAYCSSLYETSLKRADGKEINLSDYKGKTVLFVNVATRCGYTGQLDDLEKLYQKYKDKNFEIIGLPTNDFGGQTPEGDKEVVKFCKLKYGVTFPLSEKLTVVGANKSPLIRVLTQDGSDIDWNFEKFLINKNGKLLARFKSGVTPLSEELTKSIEQSLKN